MTIAMATTRKMWTGSVLALVLLFGAAGSAKAQFAPPPQGGGYQGGGGWDQPPQEFREVQQRGFHDGIEGARRDYENHRRPDVNNRDEYRHPAFRGPDRHAYREAFRRGYDVGVQHLVQGGPERRPE